MAGFVGHFKFIVNCHVKPPSSPTSRVVKGEFYYPFSSITLYALASEDNLCANETAAFAKQDNLDINYKSEAQYFVFTGVVSMIFVIIALVYYILFEDRQKEATSTDVGLFSFPVVVSVILFIGKHLSVTCDLWSSNSNYDLCFSMLSIIIMVTANDP